MDDAQKARLRWAFIAHEYYIKALEVGGAYSELTWEDWKQERDKALGEAGLPVMTELDEAVDRRLKDQKAVKAVMGTNNA